MTFPARFPSRPAVACCAALLAVAPFAVGCGSDSEVQFAEPRDPATPPPTVEDLAGGVAQDAGPMEDSAAGTLSR